MEKTRGRRKVDAPPVNWDTAIEDAETEIKRLKRRISVLEGGIVVFRDRKDRGDAFPGEHYNR